MMILMLLWWAMVAYLALRFIMAVERAASAHERIARDLGRLADHREIERNWPVNR